MCVDALLKSATRHMQASSTRIRHKADRLTTGVLKLLLLAIGLCFSPQSDQAYNVAVAWRGRSNAEHQLLQQHL